MIVYTYSEARQNLASLLDRAAQEGEVRIRRRDGQVFVVKPEPRAESPLEVEGVDLGLTRTEILQFIQEGRRPYETEAEPGDE
jgi:antitoxin (DNA-binding transcriptional repressor) of toxin-antitoxin stability system